MPTGLSSLETAIDTTVEAQITQKMTTMARQASFSALKADQLNIHPGPDPNYRNREQADYFFTDQGEEIKDPDQQQRDYVYAAAVVSHAVDKAETSDGFSNPEVATVRVTILKRSAPEKLRVFSLFVANNGIGP